MFNKGQGSPSTSSPGSKSRFYLPPSLRVEVRSPGFSSRISALVEEGKDVEVRRRSSPLKPPPGAANYNPKYSGFGTRPKIILNRSPLPLLSPRNSSKFGLSPKSLSKYPITTVKVAPSTPFSPFRNALSQSPFASVATSSVGATVPSSGAISDAISSQSPISDPRKVVMALQELSRSRKRGLTRRFLKCNEEDDDFEDEEEETGSKRARRDSSSSIGSSLSMEMPPLFSNGVIGQTTSHLVSRETDLSLTSLLSKSQAIFGHTNKNIGSHIQSQANIGLAQQTLGQQTGSASKKHKVTTNEIQSSLSSSICLKRGRDSSSGNESSFNDDQENDVHSTSKNRIVAPGSDIKSIAKRPKPSGCSSCMGKVQEPGNKKRVSFSPDEREILSFGPKTSSPVETRPKGQISSSVIKGIKVPTLSEVVGSKKLSPKKFADLDDELESRKTLITSIEALDHDKEHDRKRARYLLSGIEPYEPPKPVETIITPPAPVSSSASVLLSLPISSSTLATVLCAPTLAAMTSASSVLNVSSPKISTPDEVVENTETEVADVVVPAELAKTSSGLTLPSFGATLVAATPLSVSSTPSLLSSTTFSLPKENTTTATTTSSAVLSGVGFGSLVESTTASSSLTTSTTTSFASASTTKPSSSLFSFGVTPSSTLATVGTSSSSVTTTAASTPSFSSISTPAAAISLGDNKSTAPLTTSAAPSLSMFAFNKTTASLSFGTATTTVAAPSLISSTIATPKSDSPPKPASFAFGGFDSSNEKSSKPFSFGEAAGLKTNDAPSSNIFSFGAKPSSTEQTSDQTKFSFGSQPVDSKESSSNLFTFGGVAAAKLGDAPNPSFSFGTTPKLAEKVPSTTPLAFSFGKSAANTATPPAPTFSFAKPIADNASLPTAATTTSSTTPTPNLFQFGSTGQSKPPPASNPPGLFQFGNSQGSSSVPAAQPKPYGFGAPSQAPATDIFKFGSSSSTSSSTTSGPSEMFKFGQSGSTSSSVMSFSSALKSAPNTASPFQANPSASLPSKAISLPQFGAPAPPSNNIFTFGSSSQTPANPTAPGTGMFQFGTPAPAQPPSGGFSFTSPQNTPSASFGSSAEPPAPAPSGGFNFNASASIPGAFSFGATASPSPSFSFGASTPAPGGFGMVASTPQGQPSMFSIGAGTAAPKGRTIAKARRARR